MKVILLIWLITNVLTSFGEASSPGMETVKYLFERHTAELKQESLLYKLPLLASGSIDELKGYPITEKTKINVIFFNENKEWAFVKSKKHQGWILVEWLQNIKKSHESKEIQVPIIPKKQIYNSYIENHKPWPDNEVWADKKLVDIISK